MPQPRTFCKEPLPDFLYLKHFIESPSILWGLHQAVVSKVLPQLATIPCRPSATRLPKLVRCWAVITSCNNWTLQNLIDMEVVGFHSKHDRETAMERSMKLTTKLTKLHNQTWPRGVGVEGRGHQRTAMLTADKSLTYQQDQQGQQGPA